MANTLIQIRLTSIYPDNFEAFRNEIEKFYLDLFNKAVELNVWENTIKAIIITDAFSVELEKQAELWNISTHILKEKGYAVVSKTLFNYDLDNPEYHIFFPLENFYSSKFPHVEVFFGQVINIFANRIIPYDLRKEKLLEYPVTLSEYITFASINWVKAVFTRKCLKKLLNQGEETIDQNSFLIAFKRKLKRGLYEYNSDRLKENEKLDFFWKDYFDSLNTLILRLCEFSTDNPNLKLRENDLSSNLLHDIISEIVTLEAQCINDRTYDISSLKEAIKEFSAHFDVFLEKERETGFYIRFTKDPKDYFIDEIVETEPRIVCFMDILGFKDLIDRYEKDITSTVLQDIQESFQQAKTQFLESPFQQNKDAIKHLKYQTFSDNICISIPYFDNEVDFISNFNLLSVYVRGFQYLMMIKGIFMRGGISTGSYYADSNIIFSKGLVNAYCIESKQAIYPRIVLDKAIIEKLLSYNHEQLKQFALSKTIVFDKEDVAFLNPFGLLESSIQQIESFYNYIESDSEDEFIRLANSLTKMVSNMTGDLLRSLTDQEKKTLEPIKDKVEENRFIYSTNERVLSKYEWLADFINWYENTDVQERNFYFLSEKLG